MRPRYLQISWITNVHPQAAYTNYYFPLQPCQSPGFVLPSVALVWSCREAHASVQAANTGMWDKGSADLSWVDGIQECSGVGLMSFGGVLANSMEISVLSGLPSLELLKLVNRDEGFIPGAVTRFAESPMPCAEVFMLTTLCRLLAKCSFGNPALLVISFWFCSWGIGDVWLVDW